MPDRNAVILVDHKNRDLLGAALIAYHLEQRGIRCHLEPLESYHGCLAAFAPDLILFNHINSSHLVRYSHRLHDLGVLTAVLPNEGILYDEEVLRYNSGRFHKGSHMDFYFCWNEVHQKALIDEGPGGKHTRIEVCGVPRFDFYLDPWKKLHENATPAKIGRPKILVCTNLAMARYVGLADADAARFFEPFQRNSGYQDYRTLIACHARAREKLILHLERLASSGLYDIVLRPHPREVADFYIKSMSQWSHEMRNRVTLDNTSNIADLILSCDLEISCETCTTAMETWIVGKPTVELVFERHPTFFHENQARLNALCEEPEQLLGIVAEALANPEQPQFAAGRREHLAKWCHSPDGRSSERLADTLAKAIHAQKPSKRKYTANEKRKAAKLLALRKLDLAYNFDPMLWLKRRIAPKNYSTKSFVYNKTIRPSDVEHAKAQILNVLKKYTK
ncbi:MAG: surface carbohydrate biosynthesis protein [Verrucomicrobiota bacterium]